MTREPTMRFVDLDRQQARIRERIEANIRQVLDHGNYIMGPEVGILEARLAAYVGSRYAVGCASGTDALLMALMAYGVGPGDAIFTTPFTFTSTAEVICLLGATPIFVDIDPATFTLDPERLALAVEALKTGNPILHPLPVNARRASAPGLTPRGIIAVDLFGLPADYEAIHDIADRHALFVIQDAAQSFGAEYKGRRACGQGHIGCTSFFPAKPLGCYGDGGMCFSDDEALTERMRSIRMHGKGACKYDNVRLGINGRLDTLQAAILLAKFDIFPEEVSMRREVARRYRELLIHMDAELSLPTEPDGRRSVWAQYSVLTRNKTHRSRIRDRLKRAGIPTAIYYPKPLHLQAAYDFLGYGEGDFPISEACASRILSLPMHPYLEPVEQQRICQTH